MLLGKKLRHIILKHFVNATWQGIFVSLAVYITICKVVLTLSGDAHITGNTFDFLYWLVVTGSTVGYGDLSPSTQAGKIFTSLFVIPFGLGLFAVVFGRMASFTVNQWKKAELGMKTITAQDHIVVIGWNGPKTLQLLKLLVKEASTNRQRDIVLCCNTNDLDSNPLPDDILFAKVPSYNEENTVSLVNLAEASCIIINTPVDDLTLTSALYCHKRNPHAHLIAYFDDEHLSDLLKEHCPTAECVPSVSVEMLAKSAMDPGSSHLHHELLNASKGMTQYSLCMPDHIQSMCVGDIFQALKEQHNATIIAYRSGQSKGALTVNPGMSQPVNAGDTLYYIASERIHVGSISIFRAPRKIESDPKTDPQSDA